MSSQDEYGARRPKAHLLNFCTGKLPLHPGTILCRAQCWPEYSLLAVLKYAQAIKHCALSTSLFWLKVGCVYAGLEKCEKWGIEVRETLVADPLVILNHLSLRREYPLHLNRLGALYYLP